MSSASRGRSREWLVRDDLKAHGYIAGRFAASKGPHGSDVVAVNEIEVLFIAVRKNRWPSPEVRQRLHKLEVNPVVRVLVAKVHRDGIDYAVPHAGDLILVPWFLPGKAR